MNLPEYYRKKSIDDIFNIPTFRTCWTIWKPEIDRKLGENYSATDILNLGDTLSEIFKMTGQGGRDQGSLSGGGTAWEALVCWYLNLCMINSRAVAIRRMSLIPKHIQDSITVNYSNFPCNTESDITVLIFPDSPDYNNNIEEVSLNRGSIFNDFLAVDNSLNINVLDSLIERDFNLFEIGIIQCKTNWNDNAQIPMLWDMIYSSGGFTGRNITIGRNNYSIQNCHKFTYSFVTVPTNQRSNYTSGSVAVQRVYNLSGGNYWGKPTSQNICRSIKEIFNNNFQSAFRGIGARGCINLKIQALNDSNEEYSYFHLY
ncbi:hypothetical protein [Chryseobacterium shigense]|uniref:Uncharacterized protein n=1 Tax=Chryseobacterium shigense TaxID=297244 RepID=A0A841NAV5_9FLAO|nr:hypothetical protein [Chryseobacterium shigense]MBB6370510.1 hypothetical protein [Chryseobacterium shigense]